MKKCVRQIDLSNSMTVMFYDSTRRYYEDYHLVRVEIECEVVVDEVTVDDAGKLAEVRGVLGDAVHYRRTVEKLGVPFLEIEKAREDIIATFISTAVPYLSGESFPQKFVHSELKKLSEKKIRGFA